MAPRVRLAALIFLSALGSCSGSSPPATAVTLVADNTLAFDIFVPDSFGEGGMAVESQGGGGAGEAPLQEAIPCPCLDCANACSEDETCSCNSTGEIHRIAAGTSFTRTFKGLQFPATRADCGTGDLGPVCYQAGQPIGGGTYVLQLCYASDATGASTGQTDFAGTLAPSTLTCVTKTFTYPATTRVVIEPTQPPPCGANGSCPSGQICQQGICSANCLANSVPPLGATWDTSITLANDEALFVTADGGNGVLRQTATGVVGSATYTGTDLDLNIYQDIGVGMAIGEIRVALAPNTPVVPFSPGETVSVLILTTSVNSIGDSPVDDAAGTIRDSNGNILIAVDQGLGLLLLQGADLAPFAVAFNGAAFACDQVPGCGTRIDSVTTFTDGSSSVAVNAGATGMLSTATGTYAPTVVANFVDQGGAVANCGPQPVTAYDLVLADRQL